jgi:hypothetical protein
MTRIVIVAAALLASAVDDPNDPFSLVRLDGDELSAEPSRLVDVAPKLIGSRPAARGREVLYGRGPRVAAHPGPIRLSR